MLLHHLLIAVSWILFCALHSLLAARGWKEMLKRRMGPLYKYYRLAYTLFAFVSFAAVMGYQLTVRSFWFYGPTLAVQILGGLLAGAGLVVMGICIRKYFMNLSGLRSLFTETPTAALEITGVHRFVRHPLYLGTFAFIWGLWILFPSLSLLIACTVITAYTLLGIRFEEQKLVDEFGEQYRKYRTEVPMLFPLLRK